jgi:protein gp37
MAQRSSIEWTDATWNPVRGCSRVSEGCRNCYAELIAARFSGPGQAYEGLARRTKAGPRWTGRVQLVERHLEDPLRWRDGRRIFVNSMSDLFHEALTDEQIDRVFAVMQAAPQHTFQVLTKRPARMLDYVRGSADRVRASGEDLATQHGWCHAHEDAPWPLPNVWLGTSAEDQATANERIPLLLQTPAAVRFISAEPLLGPINVELACCACPWPADALQTRHLLSCPCARYPLPRNIPLDWVIVGGESGPGARPMNLAWARAIVAECRADSVAVFVKQMGRWVLGDHADFQVHHWLLDDGRGFVPPIFGPAVHTRPTNAIGFRVRDAKGGNWDEWATDLRVREFPQSPVMESPPCEQHAVRGRA